MRGWQIRFSGTKVRKVTKYLCTDGTQVMTYFLYRSREATSESPEAERTPALPAENIGKTKKNSSTIKTQ